MTEVFSLASGSSGNAMLVKAGGRGLLIDAGIAPRTLASALSARGIRPGMLDGILLTHEHDDHLRGAAGIGARYRCPAIANAATLQASAMRVELGETREIPTGGELTVGSFKVRSFRVSHDAAEPVGWVIESEGARIAYATDTGCVTLGLEEAISRAQLCIVESNHDLEWLVRGPYSPLMKRRVASELGHLSNHDAASLVAERLEESGPATIWLAHLSRVNNSPALARKSALAQIADRTRVPFTLEVALRDRPSVSWRSTGRPVQGCLELEFA